MQFSLIQVFVKSFAMWLLLVISIVGLTFAIERIRYFMKNRKDIREFCERIKEMIAKGQFREIIDICRKEPAPVSRMIENGLQDPKMDTTIIYELMSNVINREKVHMENNVGTIGTISHIAPLIGLFGTVAGIIKSFYSIALTGSGGSDVIAMGVAEALVTTATGILIAVPAVILYNYFVRKISVIVQALSIVRDEIITELKIKRQAK
ncbi:MAG: MotA/TolQ/ExbB proton channel family protein [Elusimicrobia bacterium]|nr:MotA/TolQ/ExbB proton channel family protein [Elusimicrobiota bacterium]